MLPLRFPKGKPIGEPGRERSPLYVNQGLSLAMESYLLTQNAGTILGAVCQRTGVFPNQSSSGGKISEPPEPALRLQPLTPRQPVGGKAEVPEVPEHTHPPPAVTVITAISQQQKP